MTLIINAKKINRIIINKKQILFLFLILILMNYKFFTQFIYFTPSKQFIEDKNLVYNFTEFVKKEIPDANKKMYFIDPNTQGFENVLFTYLMLPYQTSRWCWSYGEPYYKWDGHWNDVWTCDEYLINERLPKFDYLTIFSTDMQLEETLRGSKYNYDDKLVRGIYIIQNDQIKLIKEYLE